MTSRLKADARALVDSLPDEATWDDVVYAFEFRRAVERGRADGAANRVKTVDEVRLSLGLKD